MGKDHVNVVTVASACFDARPCVHASTTDGLARLQNEAASSCNVVDPFNEPDVVEATNTRFGSRSRCSPRTQRRGWTTADGAPDGLMTRMLFDGRLSRAVDHAHCQGEALAVVAVRLCQEGELHDMRQSCARAAFHASTVQRLLDCVRRSDAMACDGDGAFLLLMPMASDAGRVEAAIANAFQSPVALDGGRQATFEPQVGVAVFPRDAATGAGLLQAALRTMRRAGIWSATAGPDPAQEAARSASEPWDILLANNAPVRRVRVSAGQPIFHAGARFSDLFLLRAGLCKLVGVTAEGREELVSLLRTGDWFGFDGMAAGCHTVTALAADVGEIWRVCYKSFIGVAVRRPELLEALHRSMARQTASERAAVLSQHALSADGRVAAFLCQWAEGMQAHGLRTDRITLRVTRSEIASHLGLRIESVSRAMVRLEREGWILFENSSRRALCIPSLPALQEFTRQGGG